MVITKRETVAVTLLVMAPLNKEISDKAQKITAKMVDDDKKRKMSQDDDQMKCEHCEEVFGTMEDLKKHINHQHYRDTYKPTDRARRIWAQTCLSRTREHKRVGKKELDSLLVVDEEEENTGLEARSRNDPDYQEE